MAGRVPDCPQSPSHAMPALSNKPNPRRTLLPFKTLVKMKAFVKFTWKMPA